MAKEEVRLQAFTIAVSCPRSGVVVVKESPPTRALDLNEKDSEDDMNICEMHI
jgi:hypothetical protein